jgi:hypothetical protein
MSQNHSKNWQSIYIGRSRNQNFTHEYRLKTAAVQSLNANSPFQYTIQPISLDVIKRPNSEYADIVTQEQKVASASDYKPAYNISQHHATSTNPLAGAAAASFDNNNGNYLFLLIQCPIFR